LIKIHVPYWKAISIAHLMHGRTTNSQTKNYEMENEKNKQNLIIHNTMLKNYKGLIKD
jgi:hypothetical protein